MAGPATGLRPAEPPFVAACGPTGAAAARVVILGIPYDGATSYRAGARAAPAAIRAASHSIESYAPPFGADLDDGSVFDAGDLAVPEDLTPDAFVPWATSALSELDGHLPAAPRLVLGGDHGAALPALLAACARHPNLRIFHIDAHGDLRASYDGTPYSHACVMARVLEALGPEGIVATWGIRSGPPEEFTRARRDRRILPLGTDPDAGPALAARWAFGAAPVYVTFDLDGLDVGELPGTGTPEPGGLPLAAVERALCRLARGRAPVVGADLTELSPPLDPSGLSAVTAARAARALLFALGAGTRPAGTRDGQADAPAPSSLRR